MALTPILNFRLAEKERIALIEMAKVYGAKNTSEFLRELVGAMCSGDELRVRTFLGRLFERISGQVQLQLEYEAQREIEARKKALKRTLKVPAKRRAHAKRS